ncbi:MAG: hypothetical protein ACI4K5_06220 [Ruminococcus sp.]
MSRGIGAFANIIYQDEVSIIYEYGGYNLNKVDFRNDNHIKDGRITINKKCIDEYVSGEIYNYIINGLITIENCSNCWWITNDDLKIDIMAFKLLFKIFSIYEEKSTIQNQVNYDI